MLTRDACRTTPESFGVRRIACIVPVWATTQRLAHLRSALAERGGTAGRQETGQRPGNPGIAEAAKLGRAALKANARRFAANMRPIIDEIMRAGATSHNAIAAKLNERNVRTARGGVWTHVQVGAILHPFDTSAAAAP